MPGASNRRQPVSLKLAFDEKMNVMLGGIKYPVGFIKGSCKRDPPRGSPSTSQHPPSLGIDTPYRAGGSETNDV